MIIVKTYNELETFFKAFNKGMINLLVIESDGGLGKTHTAETIIKGGLFIRGHATPLSIYLEIDEKKPELIVFDDVETLLNNKTTTTLLKQICDTKNTKIINYHTTAKIGNKEVPKQIKTQARTLILTNDLKRTGKNLEALLSRAHIIHFKPTMDEVLLKMSLFKKVDEEVLMAVNEIKGDVLKLNFRTYVKAKELKESKMDWKKYLYAMCSVDTSIVAWRSIETFNPKMKQKDKIKLFIEMTGKSERTYYNIKNSLQN